MIGAVIRTLAGKLQARKAFGLQRRLHSEITKRGITAAKRGGKEKGCKPDGPCAHGVVSRFALIHVVADVGVLCSKGDGAVLKRDFRQMSA